ncbi:MAG: hypothetical protein WKF50_10070, partial [Nocardioides sp.]
MSRSRAIITATLSAVLALSTAPVFAAAADWGPAQEVPPAGQTHELPRTGVFSDGSLVSVWE